MVDNVPDIVVIVIGVIVGGVLLMNAVTVMVPTGHVGFYSKKGSIIDVHTPLLKAGTWRFRRPFYRLDTYPVVVVPGGCAALVFAHIGQARSADSAAAYRSWMGDFTDAERFGGQEGFQQAVLPPGEHLIHPYAFTTIVVNEGELTYYGANSIPDDLHNALADAKPYVREDSSGRPTLAVSPEQVDVALERTLDFEWQVALDGQLSDYREVGFEIGGGAVMLGISYPVTDNEATIQKFVNVTLRPSLRTMGLRADPVSFLLAMDSWHTRLRQELDAKYRVTVTRASVLPTVVER